MIKAEPYNSFKGWLLTTLLLGLPFLTMATSEDSYQDEIAEISQETIYVDSTQASADDSTLVWAEMEADSIETPTITGPNLAIIKMTDKANKFIKNEKKHNTYGPCGRITKIKSTQKISINRDFKIPSIDISSYIIKFVAIIALVTLIIMVIINIRWNKNKSNSKDTKGSDIDEENIYNRNFQMELKKFLQEKNYKEAIKMVYIETLYTLNKRGVIKWQLAKTPAEYYYEIKHKDIKNEFLSMTSTILSVRYGNAIADEEMYNQVSEWGKNIFKLSSIIAKRK